MRILILIFMTTLTLLGEEKKSKIDHIVLIYLENRSFDNLFRGFEGSENSALSKESYALQRDENNHHYAKLLMGEKSIEMGLPREIHNGVFLLDCYLSHNQMIPDMVHRFYQNQLQINGGKNDRFVQISDEKALVMGYHDISKGALWKYAKEFTLCDNFFAAAFGGSFLNHQWLIAARTPFVGMDNNVSKYELSAKGEVIVDGILTPDGYAVNTIQPFYPPFKAKYADPAKRLLPLTYPTIGDRLSDKNISWGWYSGGYNEALALRGDRIDYQYHHNPFLYFENYKPGSKGRRHLKDEKELLREIDEERLPSVVFFKPSASDNQHPGYATIKAADEKVKQIVEKIRSKPKVWNKSLIIVTYDENGGLWDHVAPPKVDRWGPGTRIPAIIISPYAKKGFVDHTTYDTTSILRLIEWRYDLKPLGERKSNNMLNVLEEID